MKSILYILLLSLIACDYDYKAALKYAKEYCGTYESKPKFLTSSDEPSRFINNCLIAGGQSLDDCPNKLNNGIVKGTSSLIKCLLMHKWNKYESGVKTIRPGWIVTNKKDENFVGIITSEICEITRYSSHSIIPNVFNCDQQLQDIEKDIYNYYGPPN